MKIRLIFAAACLLVAAGAATTALQANRVARSARATVPTLREQAQQLQARLTSAKEASLELKTEITARRSRPRPTPAPAPATVDSAAAQRAAAIAEAIIRQRVQRIIQLETTVRPRFQRLGISETKWDEYEKLALEAHDAGPAAAVAARARGLSPAEIAAAQAAAREDVAGRIRELLGPEDDARLTALQTEAEKPGRRVARSLRQQLEFSASPLDPPQTQQLTELLDRHRDELAPAGATLALPESVLIEAQSFLSPAQLATLRRMQNEGNYLRALNELARQPAAAVAPRS